MARKRSFVILLLAILCSICMVSCPTGGESSNKGKVTVQNGIAKLEAKKLRTYGKGKTKESAEIIHQATGDGTEYYSLPYYGSTPGAENDNVKFFVTNPEDFVINGFTKAEEIASYVLDKSKTEQALPAPTASSIEVSGNKVSLTIKKTVAESSSKLVYVLSTSNVEPDYISADLEAIYNGEELTTEGTTLKNVDKYLYIYRISPKGLVYSNAYEVTVPEN